MASLTVIVDDIDGTMDARTVEFSFDGVSYEIDLSDENLQKMKEALAPWLDNARRKVGARRTSSRSDGPDSREVRKWAKEQGMEVNPRGRVPKDIIEAYLAAK